MKNTFVVSGILLLSILFFSTCKKDESNPLVDIHLTASPDTLYIVDKDVVKEIFISTQPQGKIEYSITQKPDWLLIDPIKGTIDGSILSLKVTPLKDNLDQGIYKGRINIISDIAGKSDVNVVMSVNGHPKIKTNLSALTFPENTSETNVEIENSGTGLLKWSITNTTKWMTLSKSEGVLAKGEKSKVTVSCNRANLDVNTYNTSLVINSNSEVLLPALPVSMVVPKMAAIQLDQNNLFFDYLVDNLDVYLKNTGNVNLNWNSNYESYYTLTPNKGSLARGDSIRIKVSVDRTALQTGIVNSNVFITNNENVQQTIGTQINHFRNTKWVLDRNVIDAEFCKATNRLMIVSTNPNRLSIIDPELKTIESVNLSTTPKCVSVIKDGSLAVVGHNGFITYVNLNTKTIDKEYPITCDAFDIAISQDKWAYIAPNDGQWTYLRGIDYLNGTETLHTQTGNHTIYERTRIQLQPGSKYLYLSGSYLEKMTIQNGTADYLYNNFEANTNGNFWFSDDGLRIFTSSTKIYKTSETKATDMIYNGKIESTNSILWADHSATANKVFVITSGVWYGEPTSSQIDVFNGTYFNYLTNYKLEKFFVPYYQTGGKLVNAEGRFVFANKLGTKIHTIVQAGKDSGLLNDWAIQTIEIQ